MAFGTFGSGTVRQILRCATAALLAAIALSGGAAVGGARMDLEGAFKVTPNGTAAYSVPIEVPPGTAGMAPSLSLDYASASGNGLLGMGWSLSGLPSISRCPQTVAQDGQIAGVTFTGTDRFCYGGQRLIPIGSFNGGTEYRTEIDSFSRIVAYGSTSGPNNASGPAYWQVFSKAGQVLEFGNTADSFVAATNAPSVARAWAVDKVSDLSGNYFTVSYSQNSTTGETYPLEIDYTGFNGQAPYNSVQFCYDDGATRPDPITSYQAGALITTTHRLVDIMTVQGTGNNACGGSAAPVNDYHLDYTANSAGTNRSQLSQITQKNSGGALPPLQFSWVTSGIMGGTATTFPSFPAQANSGGGWVPYIGDFNGDGKDDILWTSISAGATSTGGAGQIPSGGAVLWLGKGDGTFTQLTSVDFGFDSLIYIGDFDGSGRSSVLVENFTTACFSIYYFSISTGNLVTNGLATPSSNQGINSWCDSTANAPPPEVASLVIGDFEGTGRSSIAVETAINLNTNPLGSASNEIDIHIFANRSTAPGSFDFEQYGTPYELLSGAGASDSYPIFVGDFNGDGRADLVADFVQGPAQTVPGGPAPTEMGSRTVLINQLPGGWMTVNNQAGLNVANTSIFIGDFNGDGVSDVLLNGVDGAADSNGSRWIALGRGDGTFPSNMPLTLGNGAHYEPTIGQFAGSGRSDILLTLSDDNWVSLTTSPSTMLLLANADGSFRQASIGNLQAPAGARPFAGDFAGIGHDGIFWDYVTSSGSPGTDLGSNGQHQLQLSDTAVPDVIGTITTGLGAKTQIGYSTLAQYNFYEQGNSAVWPILEVQNTMPVVTNTWLPDGVDSIGHPFAYNYHAFRTDLTGRGSLGFAQVDEYDRGLVALDGTYFVRSTTFNQTFPLSGSPSMTQTLVYPQGGTSSISLSEVWFENPATAGQPNWPCPKCGYLTAPTQPAGVGLSETAVALDGTSTSVTAPVFIAPAATLDQHSDLDGSALQWTMTVNTYDCPSSSACFGNLNSSNFYTQSAAGTMPAEGLANNFTTSTSNIWCNDTAGSDWLVGLMTQATVTRHTPTDATGPGLSKVKTATFDANCPGSTALTSPPTGHSLKLIVNPGATDSSQTLETDDGYDTVGNPNAVIVQGSGETARQTNTNWANNVLAPAGANLFQFPRTKTDPVGLQAQFGYDSRFGTVIQSVDPNNLGSYVNVDPFDRPTASARPDGTGTKVAYAYCAPLPSGVGGCPANAAYAVTATPVAVSVSGGQISTGASIGPLTTTYFDVLHRVVQVNGQSFDGNLPAGTPPPTVQVTTQYDADGRIVKVSEPYFSTAGTIYWTTTVPDALGRPFTVTTPDNPTANSPTPNPTVTHGYHGLTQTDTFQAEAGIYGSSTVETFTTQRNTLLLKTSATDPLGNATTYQYDDFGRLAQVTDAASNSVQYFYDLMDRRTKVVDPDAGTHIYTYLSTGELASDTGPAQSAGGPTVVVTYPSYDLDGRLLQRNEPDLISSWVYDSAANGKGKLAQACTAAPSATTPQPSACSAPSYSRVYAYDSLSRVNSTVLNFGAQSFSFADTYVSAGQPGPGKLAAVTNVANSTYKGSGAVTSYGYTALGFAQSLSKTASGGSQAPVYAITSEDAALRPLGTAIGSAALSNSLPVSSSVNFTESYFYDPLFELREADNTNGLTKLYGYNTQTGNITSKSDVGSYSYAGPGPHQLSSIAPSINGTAVTNGVTASYSYDPRGNTLNGDGSPTIGTSYSWTSFDRALTVKQGVTTIAYAYDTEHRRISATTSQSGAKTSTTLYLWDDATGGYAELNTAAGALAGSWSDYFTAHGTMVGMLRTPSSSSGSLPVMSYFHTDAQGSINAISNDSGVVIAGEFYSFDPWGKRRKIDGTDDTGDQIPPQADQTTTRGYIQQEEIAGLTNLMNLNARLYNPHIGRFVSADPAGLGGGANLYAYAGNNPTSKSDPTGLAPVAWTGPVSRFLSRVAQNNAWEASNFGLAAVREASIGLEGPTFTGRGIVGPASPQGGFTISLSDAVAGSDIANAPENDETGGPTCNVRTGPTPPPAPPQTTAAPAVNGGDPTAHASPSNGSNYPIQVAGGRLAEEGDVEGLYVPFAGPAVEPPLTYRGAGAGGARPPAPAEPVEGAAPPPVTEPAAQGAPPSTPSQPTSPEWKGPVDYSNLPDGSRVGPGKPFTSAQKSKIYQQNETSNDGLLRSDQDGTVLVRPNKSMSGVTPPRNASQVDHATPAKPADPNVSAGTNNFGNARVLSGPQNREKSNN